MSVQKITFRIKQRSLYVCMYVYIQKCFNTVECGLTSLESVGNIR